MTDQPKPECVGGDIVERAWAVLIDRHGRTDTGYTAVSIDDLKAALDASPIAELVQVLSALVEAVMDDDHCEAFPIAKHSGLPLLAKLQPTAVKP